MTVRPTRPGRAPRRRTSLACAAAIVLAATIGVGCDGDTPQLTSAPRPSAGSSPTDPAATAEPDEPDTAAGPEVRDELLSALQMSASQPTVRVRTEMDAPMGMLVVEQTGTMDGSIVEGSSPMPGLGDVEFRMVGGFVYYAFPDLPLGKDWVSLDNDQFRDLTGLDLSALSGQFPAFSSGGVGEVRRIGRDDVDGRPATLYEADANLAETMQQAIDDGTLSGPAADGLDAFATETTFEYWVDDQGLVARVHYDLEIVDAVAGFTERQVGSTVSYDITFSDYGVPIDTAPPDPSTVLPFDEFEPGG